MSNDWIGLDTSFPSDFKESYFRVKIPVYGDELGFLGKLNRITDETSEGRTMRPELLRKQMIQGAADIKRANGGEHFLKQLLYTTKLFSSPIHQLVQMGDGLFEFQRKKLPTADTLVNAKLMSLRKYSQIEIGYLSTRVDFAGNVTRGVNSYAGLVTKLVPGKYLTLNLGNGKRKSFVLERLRWLVVIPGEEVDKGFYHHEYLEITVARGQGGRVYMRIIPVADENFAIPLPETKQSDSEFFELSPEQDFARREEAITDILNEIHGTLTRGIETHKLDKSEFGTLFKALDSMFSDTSITSK